jgi:hypothetical protein
MLVAIQQEALLTHGQASTLMLNLVPLAADSDSTW